MKRIISPTNLEMAPTNLALAPTNLEMAPKKNKITDERPSQMSIAFQNDINGSTKQALEAHMSVWWPIIGLDRRRIE